MAKNPWKAWHEVVQLREDLRSGDLPMHMFAADLYEVAMQSGKRPVYEDPKEFFALTYPTGTCASWSRTWCCASPARTTRQCASLS